MENKAKYLVSASVNDEILEITVEGEVTTETYEAVIIEMNTAIKASRARKAIADIRAVDKRLDTLDMYRYFRIYEALIFDMQYAIVDLPENDHYKTAAMEAGLKPLMWFNDMDAARDWIKKIP